jgi:hypothetical protein
MTLEIQVLALDSHSDVQNITQKTKNQTALTQHNNNISQYCKMVMHTVQWFE